MGLNLTLAPTTLSYSTLPVNTIISQIPAPYASTGGVTQVNVTVSKGLSPQSAGVSRNVCQVTEKISATTAPNSLLKMVVTDSAGNKEVFYSKVNPGSIVSVPVVWYGNTATLQTFINEQVQTSQGLTPDTTNVVLGG